MTPAVSSDEVTRLLNQQGADTDQGQVTIGPHTGAGLLDLPAAATSAAPAPSPAAP